METTEYTFKVPSVPPSSNAIYQIIWSHRLIRLSPEARKWKNVAKQYMPPMRFADKDKLSMTLVVNGNFYYKNGKPKRLDLTNLVKLTCDAISEHIGKDDCYIWEHHTRKQQADKEGILVHLRSLSI